MQKSSHSTSAPSAARYAASALLVAAAAGIGSFAALHQGVGHATPVPTTPEAQPASATAIPAASPMAPQGLPDFTGLVRQTGPAVVYIETAVKVRQNQGRGASPFGSGDPLMEEFFRRFFGDSFNLPQSPAPQADSRSKDNSRLHPRGSGSGFIASADGIVMTNAHVVEGADEVTVKLTDQREFKAKVLGKDERSDVAVLKIDAQGLPYLQTGDVGQLHVGEWVIAIGAPFGLENTVTAGIVSAKQRDTGQFVRFIQTDVAINPGNSGGPLINMQGQVVGINSQILSGSGGYMGVSLSIPIDEAMRVAEQIRTTGSVQRGFLGVNISDVDAAAAESLKLGKNEGAAITRVLPSSPAEKSGLQAGDIVLSFNGKKVEGSRDLQRLTGATKPGDKSQLVVLRSGQRLTLQVTTGSEQDMEKASQASNSSIEKLGLQVTALDANALKQHGLRGGVLIQAADGPAAQAGLQAGDVLLELGNAAVQNPEQLQALAARLPTKGLVSVLYRRGDWTMRSGIRLE